MSYYLAENDRAIVIAAVVRDRVPRETGPVAAAVGDHLDSATTVAVARPP